MRRVVCSALQAAIINSVRIRLNQIDKDSSPVKERVGYTRLSALVGVLQSVHFRLCHNVYLCAIAHKINNVMWLSDKIYNFTTLSDFLLKNTKAQSVPKYWPPLCGHKTTEIFLKKINHILCFTEESVLYRFETRGYGVFLCGVNYLFSLMLSLCRSKNVFVHPLQAVWDSTA